MSFPDRLKQVVEKSELSVKEFYTRTQISKSQFFNYLGGKSDPTLSFLQRVKTEFPWVDLEWLAMGGPVNWTLDNPRAAALVSNFEALAEDDKKAIERLAFTVAQSQKITKKAV